MCWSPISYLYDRLDHSLTGIYSLFEGITAASGDGSRIYAVSDGFSPDQPVEVFDSLSNALSFSTLALNVGAVSVSGDASRVIFNDSSVYSRSLTLLGNLPLRGVALASRDSSRAFVYVEDVTGARLEVYDLNGSLQPDAQYPLLRTIALPDSANGIAAHPPVTMTSSLDDATVFISGDSKLLVVPVN